MVAVLTLGSAANAMSYKSARDKAFFLTDKMAYELALSDDQYNAVFTRSLCSPSMTVIPRIASSVQLLLDTRFIRARTATLTTVHTTDAPLALPIASLSPSPAWVQRASPAARASLA